MSNERYHFLPACGAGWSNPAGAVPPFWKIHKDLRAHQAIKASTQVISFIIIGEVVGEFILVASHYHFADKTRAASDGGRQENPWDLGHS